MNRAPSSLFFYSFVAFTSTRQNLAPLYVHGQCRVTHHILDIATIVLIFYSHLHTTTCNTYFIYVHRLSTRHRICQRPHCWSRRHHGHWRWGEAPARRRAVTLNRVKDSLLLHRLIRLGKIELSWDYGLLQRWIRLAFLLFFVRHLQLFHLLLLHALPPPPPESSKVGQPRCEWHVVHHGSWLTARSGQFGARGREGDEDNREREQMWAARVEARRPTLNSQFGLSGSAPEPRHE